MVSGIASLPVTIWYISLVRNRVINENSSLSRIFPFCQYAPLRMSECECFHINMLPHHTHGKCFQIPIQGPEVNENQLRVHIVCVMSFVYCVLL